jgi:hypothetical protein
MAINHNIKIKQSWMGDGFSRIAMTCQISKHQNSQPKKNSQELQTF